MIRNDNLKKNFLILGSAHNLTEIREKEKQGVKSLWRGLSPRMVEGLLSGGVLLAAKESIHTILDNL